MNRTFITASIYLASAAATSWLWISRRNEFASLVGVLYWVLLTGIPLFFVFVYPRSLFAADESKRPFLQRTGMAHLALGFLAILLFATHARRAHNMDLPDSLVWVVLAFVVVTLTTFFVSAISLAFRGKSSLATFSSFLFWPYWLLIALLFLDPHFDEDLLAASLCFVCFVSAVLFAFAAGALVHYPKTAHAVALAAIAALPWIYTSVLRGNIYWNEWIVFNVPDREGRSATFAITSELPSVGGTVEVVSCYGDFIANQRFETCGRMRARRIPSAAQRHLTKGVRSSFDGSQTSTPGGKI